MLKGRNAVVTGSTSGIGEGVARRAQAFGANVVGVWRGASASPFGASSSRCRSARKK